jgi:D-glycero-D-manno-heptose 1,7-bisphosphate phosphatase
MKQISSASRPFVFLDKTALLTNPPLNVDPARLRFAPGWTLALERLYRAGFHIAVVSNESGIALGFHDEHAIDVIHRHVASRFASRGLEVAGFLYCPHHPSGTVASYSRACDCRLPQPGLLQRAVRDLGADLRHSWLIGRSPDDVAAARQAGCRAVLVDSGHEPQLLAVRPLPLAYEVAPDLCAAADLILEERQTEAAA